MLILLTNRDDWERYKLEQAVKVTGPLLWGSGPQEYPALVASYVAPTAERVVSAYVYVSDAQRLLSAAGVPTPPLATTARPAPGTASQDQFNRWVSAYLMALTYYLVGVSVSAEGFEAKLNTFLALVDQQSALDRAAAADLGDVQQSVLARLRPLDGPPDVG